MACEPEARELARAVLLRELFPPPPREAHTYAVLDMARDPGLWPTLVASGAPHRCLFRGALHPRLRQVAPHLVELPEEGPFTRWLLCEGGGGRLGIFVCSPAGLDVLLSHLRRFLRVADERGRKLYFRFYDPRVLRVYLPTCNEDELLAWFDGVERFLAEGPDGDFVSEYRLESGRLVTRTLS